MLLKHFWGFSVFLWLAPFLLQLAGRGLIKGRDHLMWVLLQFISGSIQKNALADFLPVMKLFDLLYPEKEVHVYQEVILIQFK